MKERPILFSAPMVRAILDGRKTQTRRVVEPQPGEHPSDDEVADWSKRKCPYGEPGDRLWVRETWGLHIHTDFTSWCRDSIAGRSEDDLRLSYDVAYAADALSPYDFWRPSIHMPRWASRITLEVTGVRVERLQDISAADAIAEGAREFRDLPSVHAYGQDPRWSCGEPKSTEECLGTARYAFGNLWESTYGPDSWAANPWAWCISFRRVTP